MPIETPINRPVMFSASFPATRKGSVDDSAPISVVRNRPVPVSAPVSSAGNRHGRAYASISFTQNGFVIHSTQHPSPENLANYKQPRFPRVRQAIQKSEFRSALGICGFQPPAEMSLSDMKGANEGESFPSHPKNASQAPC